MVNDWARSLAEPLSQSQAGAGAMESCDPGALPFTAISRERRKANLVVRNVEDSVEGADDHVAEYPEAHARALEAEEGVRAGGSEDVVGRRERERHLSR